MSVFSANHLSYDLLAFRFQTYCCKAFCYTVGFRESKTALFDWTIFRLDFSGPCCCCCCCFLTLTLVKNLESVVTQIIASRVDFIVFVLLLEAVGVREYCFMTVENRLAAL